MEGECRSVLYSIDGPFDASLYLNLEQVSSLLRRLVPD